MTRLTPILQKGQSRKTLHKFANYKLLPMYKQENALAVLKDEVSNRGDRKKAASCLQEMAQMLLCFKKNEFNDAICAKEIEAFNKCNQEIMTKKHAKLSAEESGFLQTKNKMPPRYVNQWMGKFPAPKPLE